MFLSRRLGAFYCTMTVRAVSWLKFPEFAVTLAVYVPAGVPCVVVDDDEPLPPQLATAMKTTTIEVAARGCSRCRLPTSSRPEANRASVHPISLTPGRKLADDSASALAGAVVDTVTVNAVAVPPVRLTEPGKLQVGAGLTVGLILQLRLTVPLNELDGVTARLNVAFCPAAMSAELDDPDAGAIVNPGAARTTNETALLSTSDWEVPMTFIG
jgi:hypothetical protein